MNRMVYILVGICALGLGGAQGQWNSSDLQNRATVKIIAIGSGAGGTAGSGTIVDRRGYVLTSFTTVGRANTRGGLPGTLIDPSNQYLIMAASPSDSTVRSRWVARVVRADVRQNLALLRIISDPGGRPASGRAFVHVSLRSAHGHGIETPVRVVGFPRGTRSMAPTGRVLVRRVRNLLDQLAWLELDRPLEPGYCGGSVLDESGRLIAVPVCNDRSSRVEQVRPMDLFPARWAAELRQGHLSGVQIDGVPQLIQGKEEHAVGAGPSRDERHYYRIPWSRPGTVRVSPNLPLSLSDARGRVVRQSSGTLALRSSDPRTLVVAVRFPESHRRVTAYRIKFESTARPARPTRVAAPQRPYVAPPKPTRRVAPPRPSPPRKASAARPNVDPSGRSRGRNLNAVLPPDAYGGGFFVESEKDVGAANGIVSGTILDANTGRKISGARVVVGSRGLALTAHLTAYLRGSKSGRLFRRPLIGRARSNFVGFFRVEGLPPGGPYPVAAFASGYRPTFFQIRITDSQRRIDAGQIRLTR